MPASLPVPRYPILLLGLIPRGFGHCAVGDAGEPVLQAGAVLRITFGLE